MPRVAVTLRTTLVMTVRALQLRGMFDLPEAKLCVMSYAFDAPMEDRPWQVGLIVGPSGSGKSSVAQHLFGDDVLHGYDWPDDVSVIDAFPAHLSVQQVSDALRAAALYDPAVWLRPYRVLSGGEQFRVTLARALLDNRPRVVIDEFTSVVDRVVARAGAQAVADAVRATPGKQFVAVACHDDLLPWLRPDWIIEPHAARFAWAAPSDVPALHRTSFDALLMRGKGALTFDH